MHRLPAILLLLSSFHIVYQQDIKDLIGSIFGNKTKIETKNPPVTPLPGVEECECVPYFLCNNESVINTNGVGIIDIRVDDDGPCKSYLEICCSLPNKLDKPITPRPPIRKGCGVRNSEGVAFHITGQKDNESEFGELPWMIAVMHEEVVDGNEKLNVYQCGGALIHPQAVLTAAHCVSAKNKVFKIRAGEWDTQTTNEVYPHQDRHVKHVIRHPEYYAGALFNDIAILILESPVELAWNIDVICLPPQGTIIPDHTRCIASGWGKDVFGKSGQYQVILKRIDLPIVDRLACQENLRNTRLGKHFELDKSFICAGGEPGKDTCKGDGGSPLVCPVPGREGQYQHVGIVAWGIGCGENQIPGVYVNVPLYIEWINIQMANHNLDNTVYQY